MNALFAPDWRKGVPYQRLLAEALERAGVCVAFLQGYKRVLPLTRLLARHPCDILHLHWPEAYYPRKGDAWDWFRRARFAWDLRGATRRCALATTAHNLHAHNRAQEPFARRNTSAAHRRAGVVFAHSPEAKTRLVKTFALEESKVQVIPHGDLSVPLGEPAHREDARAAVGVGGGRVALMFGAVEPYKGQEEIIRWWRENQTDATLAIVGNAIDDAYRDHILAAIGNEPRIHTEFGWLSDERLRLWLSAADATIFNYREIFTSGAANLARSWGIPILLPQRLDTVWLDEPSPWVFRFESLNTDFFPQLCLAMAAPQGFTAAKGWRQECSWDRVAQLTVQGYQRALGSAVARPSFSSPA